MNRLLQLLGRLSLRERVLLAAFLWVVVAGWLSVALRQAREVRGTLVATGQALAAQDQWLEGEGSIAARLGDAKERLDTSRTFSAIQLVGRVDSIARRQGGLAFTIASPTTQRGEIFNLHSVRIELRRTDLAGLAAFTRAIHDESPYLGLERLQVAAYKPDPRQLDAVIEIGSFELIDDAL